MATIWAICKYISTKKKHQFSDNIAWNMQNKIIDNTLHNNECPISYDTINTGEQYCICSQCKYNFLYSHLHTWLTCAQRCPICSNKWNNFVIYTNSPFDFTNLAFSFISLLHVISKAFVVIGMLLLFIYVASTIIATYLNLI